MAHFESEKQLFGFLVDDFDFSRGGFGVFPWVGSFVWEFCVCVGCDFFVFCGVVGLKEKGGWWKGILLRMMVCVGCFSLQ